jgi:NDP-sugar pyrophosphorylase family protein
MFSPEDEFIFICNKKHLENTALRLQEVLRGIVPDATILGIDVPEKETGPNYAISFVSHLLDAEPVFVAYCDFYAVWERENFLKKAKEKNPFSASVCYTGFHPHLLHSGKYAGVRVSENGEVLEVKEKHSFTDNPMDSWHQAGIFYFSSGELLKEYISRAFREGWFLNGESYTSLPFNPMIESGIPSAVIPAEYFCQWGTPEDLEEYEAWSRMFDERKEKGKTEIPEKRKEKIRIPYSEESEAYKKSLAYWKNFFSRIHFHPLSQKKQNSEKSDTIK